VDREALDYDLLFVKREGGGWPMVNRVFGGELDGVLQQFQREGWAA
jgi:type I restriction enzyme R subunit